MQISTERPPYDIESLSRFLTVGKQTIYRWLRDGKLYGLRLPGGEWRIPASEVERLLHTRQGDQG